MSQHAMSIAERTAGAKGEVPSSVSVAWIESTSSGSVPTNRGTIVRRVSSGDRSQSPKESESYAPRPTVPASSVMRTRVVVV